MQISSERFQQLLNEATFESHGDVYEKQYGKLIAAHFPNCERFWRLFVVPLSSRINGYPNQLLPEISLRETKSNDLVDIAASHYSMFLNLAYTHLHFESYLQQRKNAGSFMLPAIEDFYVHIVAALDLTEMFLEKCYFVLLKCRNQQTEVLQLLSRERFLADIAGPWYDAKYPNVHEFYLSKGKSQPFPIIGRSRLLEEFLSAYLNKKDLWREYEILAQSLKSYRNIIVHNIYVGRALLEDGEIHIPKPNYIQEFRSWSKTHKILSDEEQRNKKLIAASEQLNNEITRLKILLNEIWSAIIDELTEEFYS